MAIINLISHGDKKEGITDPPLTELGKARVEWLIPHLPTDIKRHPVVCGTGQRHIQTTRELGLLDQAIFHPAVGSPDSLDTDGRILLSGNHPVPQDRYFSASRVFVILISAPELFIGNAEVATLLNMGGTYITSRPYINRLAGGTIDIVTAGYYQFDSKTGRVTEIAVAPKIL